MSQHSEYNEIEDYLLNIRLDEQTGCHIWEGSVSPNGYGVCDMFGVTYSAHKYAWIQEHGEVEDGKIIMHSCDVRRCVNVEHMSLGTKKDNTQDMISKGRQNWATPTRKLVTPSEFATMLQMKSEGASWYRIAATLGRSQQHVKSIVERHLGIEKAAA
jgi:hypothetical protein